MNFDYLGQDTLTYTTPKTVNILELTGSPFDYGHVEIKGMVYDITPSSVPLSFQTERMLNYVRNDFPFINMKEAYKRFGLNAENISWKDAPKDIFAVYHWFTQKSGQARIYDPLRPVLYDMETKMHWTTFRDRVVKRLKQSVIDADLSSVNFLDQIPGCRAYTKRYQDDRGNRKDDAVSMRFIQRRLRLFDTGGIAPGESYFNRLASLISADESGLKNFIYELKLWAVNGISLFPDRAVEYESLKELEAIEKAKPNGGQPLPYEGVDGFLDVGSLNLRDGLRIKSINIPKTDPLFNDIYTNDVGGGFKAADYTGYLDENGVPWTQRYIALIEENFKGALMRVAINKFVAQNAGANFRDPGWVKTAFAAFINSYLGIENIVDARVPVIMTDDSGREIFRTMLGIPHKIIDASKGEWYYPRLRLAQIYKELQLIPYDRLYDTIGKTYQQVAVDSPGMPDAEPTTPETDPGWVVDDKESEKRNLLVYRHKTTGEYLEWGTYADYLLVKQARTSAPRLLYRGAQTLVYSKTGQPYIPEEKTDWGKFAIIGALASAGAYFLAQR